MLSVGVVVSFAGGVGVILVVGLFIALPGLLLVALSLSLVVGLLVSGLVVGASISMLLSVSLELSSVMLLSVVSVPSALSVSVCVVLVSGSDVVSFSLLQATRVKTKVNASNSDKNFFIFLSSIK